MTAPSDGKLRDEYLANRAVPHMSQSPYSTPKHTITSDSRIPPVSWILSIRPKAKADLRRAHDWYEERSAGLGDEFLAAHAETFLRLEANPERFPFYYRDFRRVLTRRFPYQIFFRIVGQNIVIFRILHGAQDHTRQLRP